MGSALSWGCAGSPPRAAPPPGIPPNVTLVATPIALLASADAAPLPGPAASSEPAPPPAEALAPLPTPSAPTPGPPATANVLMSDELPFFPVRLRAHDADRRRAAHDRDATHEAHDRDATHEAHEAHEAHEGRGARKRPYHPAPGIIVDVTDAQGGATAADLQRIARNAGYWPFRECYEEGLRGDQRLSGKVSLELVVNPSGGIDRSTITASTVRDAIVGACVARETRHVTMPPASSQTTAKLEVSLATGDEAVTTARPFPNAESLRESLRAKWDAASQCYATGLAAHPDIGGRLELRFRVHHDGEIFEVAEVADHDVHFSDIDVTRCVLGVYRTGKLPSLPRSSRERAFVYALHFESKPDETVAP